MFPEIDEATCVTLECLERVQNTFPDLRSTRRLLFSVEISDVGDLNVKENK